MVEKVQSLHKRYRIAVAWAQDGHTLSAIHKAVSYGIADAVMIGQPEEIKNICRKKGLDYESFSTVEAADDIAASDLAVRMALDGDVDIVMKGLVGTDKFLRSVMDKNQGLMKPDAVISYVCAIELPEYHKLLFVSDPAVIPVPNLKQKVVMAEYAIEMAGKFGIHVPKIALISASEKPSRHFESSSHYVEMCKMARNGLFSDCIMDGPLDIFLACDKESNEIKGVDSPVNGDADILLFPSLESSNPFYKALMLFAHGELAGIIRGTQKPVVVMSRSESEKSKFYCIALSCLMA